MVMTDQIKEPEMSLKTWMALVGRTLEAVKSAGDDPPASCAGYNMAAACR